MFMKLFAGSLLGLGMLVSGAVSADQKSQDCCAAKLACCQPKSACCGATKAAEKTASCCTMKLDGGDAVKACCGPQAKTGA